MVYSDFTLAQLRKEYNLVITGQAGLFADAPPAVVSDLLRQTLARQTDVALNTGSEKARSEFLIAPILIEAHAQARDRANLFSGLEFTVDAQRGLSGFFDFFYTLAPLAIDIQAPVISVVEAKKEDINAGIPQCLAERVAAQIFNAAEGRPLDTLYGIIVTGEVWKFLRPQGTNAVIDTEDYFLIQPDLIQPEKIVGIILIYAARRMKLARRRARFAKRLAAVSS